MSAMMRRSLFCIGLITILGEYRTVDAFGYLRPRQYMEPCEQGYGVCMTAVECGLQKGRVLGGCALGTCCRIEKTCGDIITTNNTYFVNPDGAQGDLSCDVEVEKKWTLEGVCQMRLDLLEFETMPAHPVSGNCIQDSMTIVGADKPVPPICGRNNQQHLYIDVRRSRSIRITFNLSPNSTTRRWKIRVTQIPCNSKRLAPAGCLQYFEEPRGHLKSFGYSSTTNDSTYLLGLSYYMCFREACHLQLSPIGKFELGDANTNNEEHKDKLDQLQVDDHCVSMKDLESKIATRAYIQIDNIRFCGNTFVRSLLTKNPIIAINFVSPPIESDRNPNQVLKGFHLQYQQICTRGKPSTPSFPGPDPQPQPTDEPTGFPVPDPQ